MELDVCVPVTVGLAVIMAVPDKVENDVRVIDTEAVCVKVGVGVRVEVPEVVVKAV